MRLPEFTSLMDRGGSLKPTGGILEGPQDATGAGLQRFGQGVSNLAESIGAIAKEKESQQNTLDGTKADAHWRSGVTELEKKYTYENDQDHATWTERYGADAKARRDEAAGMISSAKQRALFVAKTDGEIAQRITGVTERSNTVARNAGRQQFSDAQEDQFTAVMAPNTGPAEAEKGMAGIKASIDSAVRTGMLTPEEGMKRWNTFEKRRAGMIVEREIEANPDAASAKLGGDVSYYRALRKQESGGDDSAQAGASTATGRYQFLRGTWNAVASSPEGKAAGLLPVEKGNDQRLDPAMQEKAIRIFTAQNASALKNAGIEANDKNLYLAHFMGQGGAIQMIKAMKANPDAPAASLFPEAASANPTIFYSSGGEGGASGRSSRTVTEVYNLQTRKFGGKSSYAGMDPDFGSGLTPEQLQSYRRRAESASERRQAETQVETRQLQATMADDVNSIRQTGTPIEGLTREKVEASLGRVAAEQFERDRTNARTFHEATRDMPALTNEQIMQRIDAARAQGGKEGFTDSAKVAADVAKQGQKVIESRREDPAASVEAMPSIRRAREEARYDGEGPTRRIQPESARALVRARLQTQEALGIERPMAVTKPEAEVFSRQLRAIGEADDRALTTFLQSLSATYGDQTAAVLASVLELGGVNTKLSKEATSILMQVLTGKATQDSLDLRAAGIAAQRDTGSALADMAPAPVYDQPPMPVQRRGTSGAFGRAARQQADNPANRPDPIEPPGTTFDAQDMRWLWENRGNPEAITTFDLRYGGGRAEQVMRDLERRFGSNNRKGGPR